VLTFGLLSSAGAHSENITKAERAPFTMRKIVNFALAAGAALAAIDPALADPQLSAECAKMDSLRTTANSVQALADAFAARLRDVEKVVAEENRYFARFDAETITLSGTVKEFEWSAPRAGMILNVVNGRAQPATWTIEMNHPDVLLLRGWTSKTLTPGMPIILTIRPLRDGSNGGQFLTATLPDGRQMDGAGFAADQPAKKVEVFLAAQLQSLRDQATAADRAVAEFSQHFSCGRSSRQ
jgi:Family of unknown function (DUF6152)